jgi:hypothetical protein
LEPIPGLPLSEAAVIEAIFHLCAFEKKTNRLAETGTWQVPKLA